MYTSKGAQPYWSRASRQVRDRCAAKQQKLLLTSEHAHPIINDIFIKAWVKWQQAQEREHRGAGCNSITAGWLGTGLEPYNRDATYWNAAIDKFGKREELSQTLAQTEDVSPVVGQVKGVSLKAVFEEHAARRALALTATSPTPATTAMTLTPAATAMALTPATSATALTPATTAIATTAEPAPLTTPWRGGAETQ